MAIIMLTKSLEIQSQRQILKLRRPKQTVPCIYNVILLGQSDDCTCSCIRTTVKCVLKDNCHDRPPVLKDHTF